MMYMIWMHWFYCSNTNLWWLGIKLSEDCCKYGSENNQNINENILAKAAAIYGDARKHVEKEQEDFNRLLSSQVDFSESNLQEYERVASSFWMKFVYEL